jgi:hypothetical protein
VHTACSRLLPSADPGGQTWHWHTTWGASPARPPQHCPCTGVACGGLLLSPTPWRKPGACPHLQGAGRAATLGDLMDSMCRSVRAYPRRDSPWAVGWSQTPPRPHAPTPPHGPSASGRNQTERVHLPTPQPGGDAGSSRSEECCKGSSRCAFSQRARATHPLSRCLPTPTIGSDASRRRFTHPAYRQGLPRRR